MKFAKIMHYMVFEGCAKNSIEYGELTSSPAFISSSPAGTYGCIVNGQLSTGEGEVAGGNKDVMMKMLVGLKEGGRMEDTAKFLETATLLRGVEHEYVLSVLRVSVEDNLVPIVVYPIVEYGSMHNFLTLSRLNPTDCPLNVSHGVS